MDRVSLLLSIGRKVLHWWVETIYLCWPPFAGNWRPSVKLRRDPYTGVGGEDTVAIERTSSRGTGTYI
jgi:hypothetical protein